jgi:hypothetical protein
VNQYARLVGLSVGGHQWEVTYGANTVMLVVDGVTEAAMLDPESLDRDAGLTALRVENAELRAALDALVPHRCEWDIYPSGRARVCALSSTQAVTCWDGEAVYRLCDGHAEVAGK